MNHKGTKSLKHVHLKRLRPTNPAALPSDQLAKIEGILRAYNYSGSISDQVLRMEDEMLCAKRAALPVKEMTRKFWDDDVRPIINAIGEISVQEAMGAVEQMLRERGL